MRKNYRVLKASSLKASDSEKNLRAIRCMIWGRERTIWYMERNGAAYFPMSDLDAKV
jgi:hypothetical protein